MENKKIYILSILVIVATAGVFYFFLSKNQWASKISLPLASEKTIRTYKIGFITDIHGRRVKKENYQLGTSSRIALESFRNQMIDSFHPDFVVDGGDTIEGSKRDGQESIDDFNLIRQYFQKISAPFFHVIGNHELRGLSRSQWVEVAQVENTYYYRDFEDLRVIILDGNENEKLPAGKCIHAYCMSEEQIEWLKKALSEKVKRTIVFIHYPVVQNEVLPQNILFSREQTERLKKIFSANGVLAVFSGHIETLEAHEIDGVKYFVIPGLERSERKNILWLETFAEITIKDDVEIKIFYKKDKSAEYHTLIIPSQEFNDIEK